jgi:hypothetical protein
MLTDYIVHCPHVGCGWYGPLFPRGNRADFLPARPNCRVVAFECPRCRGEWHAEVIGDDVKPLPVEELVAH